MSEASGKVEATVGASQDALISKGAEDAKSCRGNRKDAKARKLVEKIRLRWAEVIYPSEISWYEDFAIQVPDCVADVVPVYVEGGMNMAAAKEAIDTSQDHQLISLAKAVANTYQERRIDRILENDSSLVRNEFNNSRLTPEEAYNYAVYQSGALRDTINSKKVIHYMYKTGKLEHSLYSKLKDSCFKLRRDSGRLVALVAGTVFVLCSTVADARSSDRQDIVISRAFLDALVLPLSYATIFVLMMHTLFCDHRRWYKNWILITMAVNIAACVANPFIVEFARTYGNIDDKDFRTHACCLCMILTIILAASTFSNRRGWQGSDLRPARNGFRNQDGYDSDGPVETDEDQDKHPEVEVPVKGATPNRK